MSFYRQQLEEWLKELVVDAELVYDIGGDQGHVKDRVGHWDVKEYKVLDLPDYDMNEIFLLDDKADVIFCLEVFEYLYHPVAGMFNISDNLAKGGHAFVTFAFAYPHHNELERDSLRYTEFGIRTLAEKTGLKVENIWYRKDKSGKLIEFYQADGMRMAKQYPYHDVTGFIVEFKK